MHENASEIWDDHWSQIFWKVSENKKAKKGEGE